jgi:hypothetical protein
MTVVKGGDFGVGSRGTTKKGNTFATVKGQLTAKIKPIPTYTNTTKQSTNRTNHAALVTLWHTGGLVPTDKAAFNKAASRDPRPISGFNKFISNYRQSATVPLINQLITEAEADLAMGTWTFHGKATSNTPCKIVIYNSSGVYLYEKAVTVAVLAWSVTVAQTLIGSEGFFQLYSNDVTCVGVSGLYPFPLAI